MEDGFDEMVVKFKRGLVRELLDQCTEPQKAVFNRLYSGGVERLTDNQARAAYFLCRETVVKNKEELTCQTEM